MGVASVPARARRQPLQPWPRHRRRLWPRSNDIAAASVLMSAIPSLPRSMLARLTERLINRLDDLDGDPDVELNGDEMDDDGDRRDLSWSEWQTRAEALSPGGHEVWPGEIATATEDDEDDDPAGGAIEDQGEREDWRPEGIVLVPPRYGVDQRSGPVNEDEAERAFWLARARQ